MKRLTGVCVATAALVCVGGCGDGDDEDAARRSAREYVIKVERITDRVDRAAVRALTTLNRVADDAIDSRRAIVTVEASSTRAANQSKRLAELTPPAPAEQVADDLEHQIDSLALDLGSSATDLRVAERADGDLPTVGRSDARVVLGAQSGISALSRALRALALESAD